MSLTQSQIAAGYLRRGFWAQLGWHVRGLEYVFKQERYDPELDRIELVWTDDPQLPEWRARTFTVEEHTWVDPREDPEERADNPITALDQLKFRKRRIVYIAIGVGGERAHLVRPRADDGVGLKNLEWFLSLKTRLVLAHELGHLARGSYLTEDGLEIPEVGEDIDPNSNEELDAWLYGASLLKLFGDYLDLNPMSMKVNPPELKRALSELCGGIWASDSHRRVLEFILSRNCVTALLSTTEDGAAKS